MVLQRRIRSYVRREGRLTPGQQRALDEIWDRYGLAHGDARLKDLTGLFGRMAPKVLEIGFGNGESLARMARAEPETDFIGIEVHRPGVGQLLKRLDEERISNVRLLCHDAVEVLRDDIAIDALQGVQVYFPDPWHKKRHHRRRLIQPEFMQRLASRVAPGGFVHLATDWEDYAEHMLWVLESSPVWRNRAGQGAFIQCPRGRPETKFERRGRKLGHGVWDLLYERT